MDPSFSASLDGKPLSIISAGRWARGPLEGTYRCDRPSLQLELAVEQRQPGAVLTLRDDSLTLEVPLGDLLVPRTMELVDGTTWSFIEGEPFTVSWIPAADLRDSAPPSLSFRDGFHAEQFLLNGTAEPLDGTIELATPRPAPVHGQGFVTILVRRTVTPCPSCTVTASYELMHEAVVQPAP